MELLASLDIRKHLEPPWPNDSVQIGGAILKILFFLNFDGKCIFGSLEPPQAS